MIGSMSVTATTDAGHIAVLLDQRLAADPVRATVLGSGRPYPALFTAGWDGTDLASAIALVRGLPELAGVSGPAQTVEVAVAALAGQREQHRIGMRLFRLDELTAPDGVVGKPRT